jgi:hypothetical protein
LPFELIISKQIEWIQSHQHTFGSHDPSAARRRMTSSLATCKLFVDDISHASGGLFISTLAAAPIVLLLHCVTHYSTLLYCLLPTALLTLSLDPFLCSVAWIPLLGSSLVHSNTPLLINKIYEQTVSFLPLATLGCLQEGKSFNTASVEPIGQIRTNI